MHRRLLFLLVAALLVRAWVGEAMAGQMLVQQLQGPYAAAVAAQAMPLHGPDCPGMALGDGASPAELAAASALHCQDCGLNALPAAMLSLLHPPPSAQVRAVVRPFSSAEAQPGFKPPIA